MEPWHDFFVAAVGAAGALGGLLLAAVSVNIEKIIAYPALPPRVAQTLIAIGGALVVSSVLLYPGMTAGVFGWFAAVVGVVITLSGLSEIPIVRRTLPTHAISPARAVVAVLLIEMVGIPMLIGGILEILGVPAGTYIIATAVVLSYITTPTNGWVLLIEILR